MEFSSPQSGKVMPRDLPPLGLQLTGRHVVLVIDANVIIKDTRRMAKDRLTPNPNFKLPALFELLNAPHGRLVMSATDLQPDAQTGIPRIEQTIARMGKKDAQAMLEIWKNEVKPYLYVLDPAGIGDTPRSAEVRTPERDPDDADLFLLGEMLSPDGFLTYDHEAFHGLLTTLGTVQHGEILCAFRDDLRGEETLALLFGLPMTMFGTGLVEASKALQRRGIPYTHQFVMAAAAVGVLALFPTVRRTIGQGLYHYYSFTEQRVPDLAMAEMIRTTQRNVQVHWEETNDPVFLVARHLIRQRQPMTCTSLIATLRLTMTASELYAVLDGHPGLFQMVGRRAWQIVPPEQKSKARPLPQN